MNRIAVAFSVCYGGMPEDPFDTVVPQGENRVGHNPRLKCNIT
jgi:hypothetical protein